MFVSEDGTVVGSVNADELDNVKAKTPEAQAALDRLKAERDAGREQVARDEERAAEMSRQQNPQLRSDEERSETEKAGLQSSRRQQQEADRVAAEQAKAEQQKADEQAKASRQKG
jgi:hypothetical protein